MPAEISVTCGSDVRSTPAEITASRLFVNWRKGIEPGWTITGLHVVWAKSKSGNIRGGARKLILMFAEISAIDPLGRPRSTGALIRGGTVDILPVLRTHDDHRYLVFVEQARPAPGRTIVSTPSGMTDDMNAAFTALKELAEEVGFPLKWEPAKWLNSIVLGGANKKHPEGVAMFSSPGGSDEGVHFCAIEALVTDAQLRQLQGHRAGAADEGEHTIVHVVPFSEALDFLGCHGPSLKSVMAVLMYMHAMRA